MRLHSRTRISDDEVASILDGSAPATTRYAVRLRAASRALAPNPEIAPRENYRAALKDQILREFDRVNTRPVGDARVQVDRSLEHRPMPKKAPARIILDDSEVTMTDLDVVEPRNSVEAARVASDIAARAARKQ